MPLPRLAACAALLAGLSLTAAADPPPTKSKGQPTTETDNKALAQLNKVTGTIVKVTPTDRTFVLRIEYQGVEPKPGARIPNNLRLHNVKPHARNAMQQMMRQQQQLAQLEARQLQALLNSYKVVNAHKDFDLVMAPKGTVRFAKPPVEYDDKGFLKRYTTRELEQMKGDNPSLPGYAADFEKLKPGDSVRVTIARGSDLGEPRGGDNPDRDKQVPKPSGSLKASLVLILAEGPDPNPPAKGKKGK